MQIDIIMALFNNSLAMGLDVFSMQILLFYTIVIFLSFIGPHILFLASAIIVICDFFYWPIYNVVCTLPWWAMVLL